MIEQLHCHTCGKTTEHVDMHEPMDSMRNPVCEECGEDLITQQLKRQEGGNDESERSKETPAV